MSVEQNIELSKDDHNDYRVRVRNESGKPVNFSGGKMWVTFKESREDADPGLLQLNSEDNPDNFDLTQASQGIGFMYLTPEVMDPLDTGRVLYDIKVKTQAGKAKTVTSGEATITRSITRAV